MIALPAALAVSVLMLWVLRKGKLPPDNRWWTLLMVLTPLGPLFANSFGWIFTEMGRQLAGVRRVTHDGRYLAGVTLTELWISIIGYTLLYGVLAGRCGC
ncbi:MAG: cytochrome ubiquinol oxidase subunit I [Micropruina sp.]